MWSHGLTENSWIGFYINWPNMNTLTNDCSIQTMNLICRVCMGSSSDLCSLFTTDGNDSAMNLSTAQKIMDIARIQISQNDIFPKSICRNCLQQLELAHKFKLLCETTDRGFRELILRNAKEDTAQDPFSQGATAGHSTIKQSPTYQSPSKFSHSDDSNCCGTQDQSPLPKLRRIQKKKNRYTQYMCETCGQVYFDRSSLSIHRRLHTGERPFECDVCHKTFAAEINLKTHMRRHSGERPYICETCGRNFSTTASLQVHNRTHTGERPFPCSTCQKTFANKSNLRTHVRTHTGDKPHLCNTCGKSFSTSSDLHTHIRSHTGEKPFSCQLCSKRFSLASNLTIHLRIHSGEKRFKCTVCARMFISKASLAVHHRTHSGDRPYTCNLCGKRFTHSNTLSAHMVCHTGTRDFECEMCARKFARASSLSAHRRKRKCVVDGRGKAGLMAPDMAVN